MPIQNRPEKFLHRNLSENIERAMFSTALAAAVSNDLFKGSKDKLTFLHNLPVHYGAGYSRVKAVASNNSVHSQNLGSCHIVFLVCFRLFPFSFVPVVNFVFFMLSY